MDLHTEGSTGQSKGYGFVHFKLASDGKKCIDQMDGFELAGRAIKVSRVGDRDGVGGQLAASS